MRGDSIMLDGNNSNFPKRGEIWYANLNEAIGSQQGGIRPVLIYSDDAYNCSATTVMAIPLTSKLYKHSPVHVNIKACATNGLKMDSAVEIEKMRDINKFQLIKCIGRISEFDDFRIAAKFPIMYPSLGILRKSDAFTCQMA